MGWWQRGRVEANGPTRNVHANLDQRYGSTKVRSPVSTTRSGGGRAGRHRVRARSARRGKRSEFDAVASVEPGQFGTPQFVTFAATDPATIDGNNQFPTSYRDATGLSLSLCLSTATAPGGAPLCVLPAASATFDPAQPITRDADNVR